MDMFILMLISIVLITFSYWIGKFVGVKETFDYLEKEGKIIDKKDLDKILK